MGTTPSIDPVLIVACRRLRPGRIARAHDATAVSARAGVIPALREGLATVDYKVEAIAAISRRPSALGHKFNLIPPPERNLTL
jgi:hypothetical protein